MGSGRLSVGSGKLSVQMDKSCRWVGQMGGLVRSVGRTVVLVGFLWLAELCIECRKRLSNKCRKRLCNSTGIPGVRSMGPSVCLSVSHGLLT